MAVGNHLVGGTTFDFDVSFFDLVCQIKMMNVKGMGAFSGTVLALL